MWPAKLCRGHEAAPSLVGGTGERKVWARGFTGISSRKARQGGELCVCLVLVLGDQGKGTLIPGVLETDRGGNEEYGVCFGWSEYESHAYSKG